MFTGKLSGGSRAGGGAVSRVCWRVLKAAMAVETASCVSYRAERSEDKRGLEEEVGSRWDWSRAGCVWGREYECEWVRK